MDVERLREAIEPVENGIGFYDDTTPTLEVIFAAARDHLACGTVTDEMVEAGMIAWEAAYDGVDPKKFSTPEYIAAWKDHGDWDDAEKAMRAALEAAFRVETGE